MDAAHKLPLPEPSPEPAQPSLELVPAAPVNPDRPAEQLLLLRTLEVVRDRVESTNAALRIITEGLRGIKANLPVQRRPVSKRARAIHITATFSRRNGFCPLCAQVPVCSATEKLPTAEFDHFFARNKSKVTETWLICSDCNRDLLNSDFKNAARSAFEAYQAHLRPFLATRQVPLGLAATTTAE